MIIWELPILLYLIGFHAIVESHSSQKYVKQSIKFTSTKTTVNQNKIYIKNEIIHHLHNYSIFRPRVTNHTNRSIPLNSTKIKEGHLSKISFTIYHAKTKQDYNVLLELAPVFWSSNFVINLGGEDKYYPTHDQMKDSHCYYRGNVKGLKTSSAYFSTCKGLSGYINVKKYVIYIEPLYDYTHLENLSADHIMYHHDDIRHVKFQCDTSDKFHDRDHIRNESKEFREERSTESNQNASGFPGKNLFEPYDVKPTTKYIELFMAYDNSNYLNLTNQDDIINMHKELLAKSKEIVNIINHFFRKIGIYVILVGVEVWLYKDMAYIDDNIALTQNNFRLYVTRKVSLSRDVSVLITKSHHEQTDASVGYALTGSICSYDAAAVVVREKVNIKHAVGFVTAHELAHVLGVPHDPDWHTCYDQNCLMHPYVTEVSQAMDWSDYSKLMINIIFLKKPLYCLNNFPAIKNLFSNCGNGLKELDEECDCGLENDCNTECCNPTNCKFNNDAKCATGSCCNLKTCRIKKKGSLCRPSRSCCDVTDYCDGLSEKCPEDVYLYDGHPCRSHGENSFCYQGNCNTYNERCRFIWGKGATKSHDICYNGNLAGNDYGHCLYDKYTTLGIQACKQKDKMCGLLYCQSATNQSEPNTHINKVYHLKTTESDEVCLFSVLQDSIRHTGMVPEGSKCGHHSMCIKNKCEHIPEPPCNCPDNEGCSNDGKCYNISLLGKCVFHVYASNEGYTLNVSICGLLAMITMNVYIYFVYRKENHYN